MKRLLPLAIAAAAALSLAAAAFAEPSYDADGKIVIPENMDRWPTVGTTYALSYEGDGGTTLNTVRLDPDSYDAYVKTGKFPVGAIMQLEVRTPLTEVAPAKGGQTQGAVVGRSLHVKDEKGGPGTWTFYGFGASSKTGNAIPRSQACYSCHDEHAGKTDTVFLQYYPALKEAHARIVSAPQ
ncbi:MAG TPA: cytochrome P460 family protein [Hyphomonadaceae bacterium]|nr:cytochrome P460 family protein [Hyphomonadaceae bacterium]